MVTTVPIISHQQIVDRCKVLAAKIKSSYGDRLPLIVVVQQGAVPFAREILSHLPINTDSIRVTCKSYSGTKSTGDMQFNIDSIDKPKIWDREVLVLDDIVDSGNTFQFLRHRFEDMGAKDIRVMPLISRQACSGNMVDYGFLVPSDKFLIGFGMDLDGEYRDLNRIYTVEKD